MVWLNCVTLCITSLNCRFHLKTSTYIQHIKLDLVKLFNLTGFKSKFHSDIVRMSTVLGCFFNRMLDEWNNNSSFHDFYQNFLISKLCKWLLENLKRQVVILIKIWSIRIAIKAIDTIGFSSNTAQLLSGKSKLAWWYPYGPDFNVRYRNL